MQTSLLIEGTIEYEFIKFHEKNPDVYQKLREYAIEMYYRQRRVGISLLWERVRWDMMDTKGDKYKLPNNFRSRYARLLMKQEPELKGFFRTTQLRTP